MIGGSEMRENEYCTYSGPSKRKMRVDEGEFTAVNIRSTAIRVPSQRPPMSRFKRYEALAWGYWTAITQHEWSGLRFLG